MKHLSLIIVSLTLFSFAKLKPQDVYTDSWKLEKIILPDEKAVTHFESIWFLTSNGESGNYIPNDNELYITGKWKRKKNTMIIEDSVGIQKYDIVSWTDNLIVLIKDGATFFYRK